MGCEVIAVSGLPYAQAIPPRALSQYSVHCWSVRDHLIMNLLFTSHYLYLLQSGLRTLTTSVEYLHSAKADLEEPVEGLLIEPSLEDKITYL